MAKHSNNALQINDLHVYYGPSHILQGTNLDVPSEKIISVVGRNGVGKTTLINSVMGLLPVKEGNVIFQSRGKKHDLLSLKASQRRNIGIALVPQGRRLFRSLSVEEHLKLVPQFRDGPFDLSSIFDLFPRLKERRKSDAGTLSGGEQSMLAIARALILNPKLLLMDEPTEGLAPLLVDKIGDVITDLASEGFTILLVEQKLAFAIRVASQIAVMERGQIVSLHTSDEIEDAKALGDLILIGSKEAESKQ